MYSYPFPVKICSKIYTSTLRLALHGLSQREYPDRNVGLFLMAVPAPCLFQLHSLMAPQTLTVICRKQSRPVEILHVERKGMTVSAMRRLMLPCLCFRHALVMATTAYGVDILMKARCHFVFIRYLDQLPDNFPVRE